MNLAKPIGISLKEHTSNVIHEAQEYLRYRDNAIEKYHKCFGNNISDSLLKACKYHDLGKKMSAWQSACRNEYEYFIQSGKVKGTELSKAQIRHEIHSVLICEQNNIDLNDEEKIAILCHHGQLRISYEHKWTKWQAGAGQKLWNELKNLRYDSLKLSFEDIIRTSFKYDFLRAALQLADKRASAKEDAQQVPERYKFDYIFNEEWVMRPVQKIAKENAQSLFTLLRAPTGAGKTDASLLWANEQINILKRADRLIIALPTRFTTNALGVNISSSISQTGVFHSTAKYLHEEGIEANHYASLLEPPATVCTIDHLLYCLSKTKESHHLSFVHLASSCVVIDEADFYDEFTQANLLVLLEVLRILQVPVLLMSASLPNSSIEFYQKAGHQINCILEDTSDLDRDRCEIVEIREYSKFDDIEELLDQACEEPTIIYVNTVDRALKLAGWFKKYKREVKVEVYHSRFTEAHKIKKEKSLIKMLGSEAWKNSTAYGIAILTQIGEMSVNISANFMISEICPMDRLVQRIGRLSRFSKEAGKLIVLKPIKDNDLFPAPYGSFKNYKWTPNKYLERTITHLTSKKYSARELNTIVNNIYMDGINLTEKAESNAKKFKEMIRDFWLFLPDYQLEEDDESGHWRTRDIPGQTIVLALQKEVLKTHYFKNRGDFQRMLHQNGINCPNYLVKHNLKTGRILTHSIIINEDEIKVFVLSPVLDYHYDLGLDLSIPLDEIEDQFL